MSADIDPWDAHAEMLAAAEPFDETADTYCPKCGLDWPGCGCDADPNTHWYLECPTCGAKQSAPWSATPPAWPCNRCSHIEPVDVERAPKYAPVGVTA